MFRTGDHLIKRSPAAASGQEAARQAAARSGRFHPGTGDQLELSVNQGETDERRIPLVVGVWSRRHVGYPRNADRGTCVLLVRRPPT